MTHAVGLVTPGVRAGTLRPPSRSLVGYVVHLASLIAFAVGAFLVIAVLCGYRRPLREMGIPTPLGLGVMLMAFPGFLAWQRAIAAGLDVSHRRRTQPRPAGGKPVHVLFDGDARPPGLDDLIRQHLAERFADVSGVIEVDLYYASEDGFLITRAEMAVTDTRSVSDTLAVHMESHIESYLDRTRAHLEAIGLRTLEPEPGKRRPRPDVPPQLEPAPSKLTK